MAFRRRNHAAQDIAHAPSNIVIATWTRRNGRCAGTVRRVGPPSSRAGSRMPQLYAHSGSSPANLPPEATFITPQSIDARRRKNLRSKRRRLATRQHTLPME